MKSSDIEERIIGCIKEHGLHGASSTEISNALGINRHTLAKYLNILNAEGKIGFKRAGMGKIWFIEKSSLHGVSNGPKDFTDTGLKTTLGHILSTMPDGIVVMNENHEIEFTNDSLTKKFGDRTGEKCYRAFIGRSEPCVTCPVIEILHKGNLTSMRYQATDKDGNSYDLIASPMRNPDGSVSVIEIVRDITEMKQTEEALRESNEKFKTLAEQSPNMIFINQGGTVAYANKRCEELMGYTREEFYSPNFDFITLIAPENQDMMKSNFKRHMSNKEIAPLEYTLITKNGERIEAILTTKLITYGGEMAILGTVTDITERKKAEQALLESKLRYKTIFDLANDGIVTINLDGDITNANRAAEEMTGYKKEEVSGVNIMELNMFPPASFNLILENFSKRISGIDVPPYEVEMITKSGKKKFVEISATPLMKEDKIIGDVAILRDITERKKAEDRIKYLNEIKRSLRKKAVSGTPAPAPIPEA